MPGRGSAARASGGNGRGSDRPRGQQAGAAGHGRTPSRRVSKKPRGSSQPFAAARAGLLRLRETAYVRERLRHVGTDRGVRHRRTRPRVIAAPALAFRSCDCAAAPPEVSAPPVARLFANTPYGTSVWARFPYERYACLRPLNRVADWLTGQGLADLGGDAGRRRAAPRAAVRAALGGHPRAPETRPARCARERRDGLAHRGRVGEAGGFEPRLAVDRGLRATRSTSRCRPLAQRRRGGEAVRRRRPGHGPGLRPLLGVQEARARTRRPVDARILLGPRETGFHQVRGRQRDAGGLGAALDRAHRAALPVERGAAATARRRSRCRSSEPGVRGGASRTGARARAIVRGGATGTRRPPGRGPRGRAAPLPVEPSRGLERVSRQAGGADGQQSLGAPAASRAAIGRRLSFGSDSEAGARFTATMYSAVGTLALNGVDVLRWLTAWLSACADNGGRAPGDLSPWLPWSMDAERRNELMAPG